MTSSSYALKELNDIVITTPGYLVSYLSYYSTSDDQVYFDDFRVTLETDSVIQTDDYYPFGLTFNSYTSGQENLYKVTGKEEQQETGWVDFGARMYDPAIGRWNQIDPFADAYNQWTPYNYTMNNPVRYIDPNGMYSTEEWKKDNGITDDALINVYQASESDSEDDQGGNSQGSGNNSQVGPKDPLKEAFDRLGSSIKDVFEGWFGNDNSNKEYFIVEIEGVQYIILGSNVGTHFEQFGDKFDPHKKTYTFSAAEFKSLMGNANYSPTKNTGSFLEMIKFMTSKADAANGLKFDGVGWTMTYDSPDSMAWKDGSDPAGIFYFRPNEDTTIIHQFNDGKIDTTNKTPMHTWFKK